MRRLIQVVRQLIDRGRDLGVWVRVRSALHGLIVVASLGFLLWVAHVSGHWHAADRDERELMHAAQRIGDAAEHMTSVATLFSQFLAPEAEARRTQWLERMACATDPRACARLRNLR